ncbi:MAG TPA: ABC transporter permease [Chitinophagaceae bacterium]|jgi:ABC-type antimicrobial peptide transport system permease subunit|nr:ABC transporter permease [Chitinophagaceae bacterium]
MFRNHFKIAWRTLVKNKLYSFINIAGLATGMGLAILIGLWIWDELSFNKYHQNYRSIARVMVNQTFGDNISTDVAIPLPLKEELKNNYASDFKNTALASWEWDHSFKVDKTKISKPGMYVEPDFLKIFSIDMIQGSYNDALNEPSSIVLSASAAKSLFGDENPVNKTILFDNNINSKITGVFADLPMNSEFHGVQVLLPWSSFLQQDWVRNSINNWGNNSFQLFTRIGDKTTFEKVTSKIKDIGKKYYPQSKPEYFLQPMSKWHLYSEFKNGKNAGGKITFVWLFGITGLFILFLACINFMNLSTARSERRAKEVGIRKASGSMRWQLIIQFFIESLSVVLFAFQLSIFLVELSIPFFNEVANKKISIPWSEPLFWLAGLGFSLFTGLIAGSYPALYLSSFQPVKVLKGTFRAGRFAAVPRKVLVVLQFTVSVALIIGTIIVYRQIQFAKDRPIGYSNAGLIQVGNTEAIKKSYNAFRNDLLKTGTVYEVSQSSSPTTAIWGNRDDFTWEGKDPQLLPLIGLVSCTYEFGKTIGWKIIEGRDFSTDFKTDSSAVILNEAAMKLTELKNIIGKTITDENNNRLHVIGVVRNIIMESPYSEIKPTFFVLGEDLRLVNIKLMPAVGISDALGKVQKVFKTYNPEISFDYKFADQEYSKKFGDEVRISKLSTFFALLAILISCLGLFGLVSFVAEQRTREIGIRKVLGASVSGVVALLSKDFLKLITIAIVIASPFAWFVMNKWLQDYAYRISIGWWVFIAAGSLAILVAFVTISLQAIKAAIANPVKSLHTE